MAAAAPSSDEEAAVVWGADAKEENDNNEAEPVASGEGARQGSKPVLDKTEKIYVGVMVLALLAIALALGLVFGLREPDEIVMAPRETPVPTATPLSQAPSSAPTGILDSLLQNLPNKTIESLQTFGTPQSNAFDWLANHPEVTNLPDWRKMQLFALSTFYYAFEGLNWNPLIQERWMDGTVDECLWYSSAYEDFAFTETNYILDQCNENGEYQGLALSGLGLAGLAPFVPPEMALLTSLKSINLNRNGINASLSAMIPTELSQLATLTHISLANNSLTGTIPTELQDFTALMFLDLSDNNLTGVAPALNLETFNISGNNLSG